MRFLLIYAHPVEDSFGAAVHRTVVETLRAVGHEVDDCDLYAEGFQPVLSREERRVYNHPDKNRPLAPPDVDRLLSCDGLVFVFPTWWHGPPAILKGYLDRVFLPGVAFALDGVAMRPLLKRIVRFAVVTTHGSPWWVNKFLLGDPCRKVFMRGMRHLFSGRPRTMFLAKYGMDRSDDASRKRFLAQVEQRMRNF